MANKVFPDGPVVKNPPCNAGDTGSIPGPGRSHMPQGNEASDCSYQRPSALQPRLCNQRSHCSEKPGHHHQRNPADSGEDPAQPKINKQIFKGKKGRRKRKKEWYIWFPGSTIFLDS